MNVYDFDNTVYDGETLVDFILYYVFHDKKIWKYGSSVFGCVQCIRDWK